MAETKSRSLRFVVCLRNTGYEASLERNKIYRMLPDRDARREDQVRIVDESGEDYLYPANWFAPIRVPPDVRASLIRAPR
jgi:hypothetical protein